MLYNNKYNDKKNTSTFHLAWSSDTHFNFANQKRIAKFCEDLLDSKASTLLLTGDIAESDTLVKYLKLISSKLGPTFHIYFILGNHDYYKSSIPEVNNTILQEFGISKHPNIHWLTSETYVELTPTTALVGNENWWDGKAGNLNSLGILDGLIMAPDYTLIKDFSFMKKEERFKVLETIANNSTKNILEKLRRGFDKYHTIYLALHVPPFEDACVHNRKIMEPNWLPHFCHKDLGDKLMDFMSERPEKELVVLAGHTHENITIKPLENIKVKVAHASYFQPEVHKIIKISDL